MICKICNKEFKNSRALLSHVIGIHKITSEKYYLNFLDGNKKYCELCGKETSFRNIKIGYSKLCKDCSHKFAGLQNKNKTKEEKEAIEQKRKNSNLKKYGVESVWQRNDVKEKRKETLISNFGVDSPLKNKEIKEKREKTNLNRYGQRSSPNIYSKEVQDKKRKTCLEKYGVEFVTQSNQVKQKSKETCFARFGVEFALQAEEVKKKSKLSISNHYGVENPSKSEEIKEKKKQTLIKHFGVENALQSNEIKNKIKKTNLNRYGVENPQQSREIKEKTNKTRFNKYYDLLLTSNRLKNLVIPLFKKEDYIGNKEKYLFKCNKCGNEFLSSLSDGDIPRCIKCFPLGIIKSKAEDEIILFLRSLLPNEKIIHGDRNVLKPKELDIFIPKKSFAIEYNGLKWHSDSIKPIKEYHLNKTQECESKNIRLIHIFEDEWILQKEIVKNKLKSVLNINNTNKIYARKCILKEISVLDKNEFLETYHIQGKDISKIKIGAFYNDELVGVMTFGNLRLALGSRYKKDTYELIRFATKTSVIGLASKMLTYFINKYNPEKIISYADRRWTSSKNNLYEKIGFSFVHSTEPNYWYINEKKLDCRIHRFVFRKSELKKKLDLFDPKLSEWQNMQLNGYTRIWDCGNLKYEMNFNKK